LPKLIAEDIVNSDMVGIATAPLQQLVPIIFHSTAWHEACMTWAGWGLREGGRSAYVR
jgi:hypothetical protein